MTTVVKKIGEQLVVEIPDALVSDLKITEGTLLEIRAGAEEIVLYRTRGRPRRPISEIVAQIDPEAYRRVRREFGGSGGKFERAMADPGGALDASDPGW